jgi:PAS domain S-box-containing protein
MRHVKYTKSHSFEVEMDISFKELVDIKALKKMVLANYAASGVPIGIIDAISGEIYAAAGWQRICTDFHRKHPDSCALCLESDTAISGKISKGESLAYKCKNGLWDIGIPIMCDNQHIASIFLGQFLYGGEKVDKAFFVNQANKYGFNLEDYLEALEAVPVFTQEKVASILEYNKSLAEFLSNQAMINLRFRSESAQRKQAELLHTDLFNNMALGVLYQDHNGYITHANPAAQRILGLSLEQMQGRHSVDPRWKSIYLDGSPFPGEKHPPMVALHTGCAVHDVVMGIYNPAKDDFRWILINSVPQFHEGETLPYQVFSTFNDITERIVAEDRLKKAHDSLEHQVNDRTQELSETVIELESIFDSSQVGLVVLRGDRIFAKGNQRLADILKYESPSEMEGLSMMAFHLTEEKYTEFGDKHYESLIRGERLQIEYQLKRKDGTPVWCSLSGKALDTDTPPDLKKGVLWAVQDITERKRLEEKSQQSLNRFKTIFEEAPLGVALIDSLTGHIYEVNEKFANIAGRTRQEMIKIDWMQITHPDDVQEDLDNMARLNAGEINGFQMEKRYIKPDGTISWINMTISPVQVLDKAHPRHLCMIEDITERKQTEKALSESEHRLSLATESAGIGIWDWDIITDEMTWDEHIFRLYGIDKIPEYYGLEYWQNCLHPDDRDYAVEACQAAVRGEKKYDVEFRVQWPDGTIRWIKGDGVVIRDDDGTPILMIGTNYDITDRKKAEYERQHLIAELKRSNNELKQFAYIASHDLQEPLRAVVGFLQLLQSRYHGQLDEKGHHYIDRSVKAARRLQGLINALLSLSRVNTTPLLVEYVNIGQIIENAVESLQVIIQEKNAHINFTEMPSLMVDVNQIQSLFLNLISSTLSHCRTG